MIAIDSFTAGMLAALMALWLIVACWATALGLRRASAAKAAEANSERWAALLGGSPVIPMIVAPDGRIDAGERLADWLGLKRMPATIGDLAAVRARSRLTEADALLDPAGLGAYRVLEWTGR